MCLFLNLNWINSFSEVSVLFHFSACGWPVVLASLVECSIIDLPFWKSADQIQGYICSPSSLSLIFAPVSHIWIASCVLSFGVRMFEFPNLFPFKTLFLCMESFAFPHELWNQSIKFLQHPFLIGKGAIEMYYFKYYNVVPKRDCVECI